MKWVLKPPGAVRSAEASFQAGLGGRAARLDLFTDALRVSPGDRRRDRRRR
jgi:hypothetical protein